MFHRWIQTELKSSTNASAGRQLSNHLPQNTSVDCLCAGEEIHVWSDCRGSCNRTICRGDQRSPGRIEVHADHWRHQTMISSDTLLVLLPWYETIDIWQAADGITSFGSQYSGALQHILMEFLSNESQSSSMETLRDKDCYFKSIAFQLIRWNVEPNFHQSHFGIFGLMKLKSDFILAFVAIRDVFQRNFKGLFMIDFEGEIVCYARDKSMSTSREREREVFFSTSKWDFAPVPTVHGHFLRFDVFAEIDRQKFF